MTKTRLLFLIILIEGYVVLASELLAMRLLIPFVGSGTETIAIIISAVLLPLAIGYHVGGRAYAKSFQGAKRLSIRRILLKNVLTSLLILTFGLSYVFLELFFGLLSGIGITHRLTQTAIYSGFFLVYPVFLLAQTVPLISHYFSRANLSEITGRMLFFSTAGSFLGSVFSTIVLMSFLGVHITVIVTLSLLCALVLLLSKRRMWYERLIAAALLGMATLMNAPSTFHALNIVSNNAYSIVEVVQNPKEESTILRINRSSSSKVSKDERNMFEYWRFIDDEYIKPIQGGGFPARDMLIIGAGGFTVGMNDRHNHYTYVDIDAALKKVAETHLLKRPLNPNQTFEVSSARAFLVRDKKMYDFILIDAYTNLYSIPMELTTREFLLDVKKRLKPNGVVIANVISSASFNDRFTLRYHDTFASVFPAFTRQVIGRQHAWEKEGARTPKPSNVLYIYTHRPHLEDTTRYSDDRNTYSLDRK